MTQRQTTRPNFFVKEDALPVGVKALAGLAFDYLSSGAT